MSQKKLSFSKLSICTPYLEIIFGSFLTKTKWDQTCKIMSMGKFGPTASNFGYDFEAENGPLRGSELGPKTITHRYDIGKIYPAKSLNVYTGLFTFYGPSITISLFVSE